MNKKDVIIFINTVSKETVEEINEYGKSINKKFRMFVVRDKRRAKDYIKKLSRYVKKIIVVDYDSDISLTKALAPYSENIYAVIYRGERSINYLKKIIPHIPYVKTPTQTSLEWSIDKTKMRDQFVAYDKSISPKHMIISEVNEGVLSKLKKNIGFPLVVKPAGLAASLLVSICFHKEELALTLKKVLKKISKVYTQNKRKDKPKLLVEQFMEGEMYSIDAYVNSKGVIYWCPFVHVKTGRSIGFDDFFGYQRITPTTLKESTQEKAKLVAQKAIYALGLRNTSAHIELMRTDDGWKAIEVGARVGGFRNKMYKLSYGINHTLNDLFIRTGKKPVIPKKQKNYVAVLNFFAKQEGKLVEIKGVKKLKKYSSFHEIVIKRKKGEMCLFAKHGGKSVCNVVLVNKSRPELLADIRRVEQNLIIKTLRGKRG